VTNLSVVAVGDGARVIVPEHTACARPLAVRLAGAMRRAVASDIDSPGVVYRHCSSNDSHVASNTWLNIEDF
jgi:hypothetical protein